MSQKLKKLIDQPTGKESPLSLKEGWLTKQGNYIKNWRPRWFQVRDGLLIYYKEPNKEQTPTNFFVLAGSQCRPYEKVSPGCFELIMANGDRRYMQAQSKAERDEWIRILQEAAKKRQQQQQQQSQQQQQQPVMVTTASELMANQVSAKVETQAAVGSDARIYHLTALDMSHMLEGNTEESRKTTGSIPGYMSEGRANGASVIRPDSFNFLKVLGKGNYGKVMLATLKQGDGRYFAVKVIKKSSLIDDESLEHVLAENRVLQTLDHPFLVKLYCSFQTDDRLYFVMEYVNGGELFFHIGREKRFTEDRVRFYAAEILLALNYLHSKGIVYRDLKLENLLLDRDGHIKITDFGLVKEGIGFNDTTSTFCGTPEYLAPEILEEENYGRSVDWWALGVVMYELMTGRAPFGPAQDMEKLFHNIIHQPIYFSSSLSPVGRSILENLMERDYTKRIGSGPEDGQEVMRHPFFKSVDFDKILKRELQPPFVPQISEPTDVRNFDQEFTELPPILTPISSYPIEETTKESTDYASSGKKGDHRNAVGGEIQLREFSHYRDPSLLPTK